MKNFTSKTQKVGEIGENIAVSFLRSKGFSIIEQNYTKPWGEIDIVAEKGSCLYFCEVKSISVEYIPKTRAEYSFLYNPAENITQKKINRIWKTVISYMNEHKIRENKEWSIDALIVFVDRNHKCASVEHIGHIV